MDLAWRPDRLCYRAAEHSLASTASLAHLRTAEQHLPQQQKRRTQPGTIHRAAGRFHESGNASAMARRPFVVARFARGPPLPRDRNHIFDHARRVHHFTWQKLLSRAGVSDALCRGRRGHRTHFRFSSQMAEASIAQRDTRNGRVVCPIGRTNFAARQTCRIHASHSLPTATYRDIAYGCAAAGFRRPVWLGTNGWLGCARLSSLASRGRETRRHFMPKLRRSWRDRFFWHKARITISNFRPSELFSVGTARLDWRSDFGSRHRRR